MPPILIIVAEVFTFGERTIEDHDHSAQDWNIKTMIRSLYSITAIVMWIRFLYFFRIFRSTGYYIHMIMKTIVDIIEFFFIYAVVVLAFGHATYIISHEHHQDFIQSLINNYRNTIGDVQDGDISEMYSQAIG